MSNNKLKNMIDNHELDDFVNNEDLKEKLCKLQTSEEVLELLKKYNYNESKEIFEVELMDLLKEFVGEEELLKVSGGKLNKQSFSNIVTSLAVAGSLCMPVQGVTDVSNSEKVKNKKSSYSVGLPPKEKSWLGVAVTTGIIGLLAVGGVICMSTFTHRLLNDEKYEEMHKHFMKLATNPEKCDPEYLRRYKSEELRQYILRELVDWMLNMDQYCVIKTGEKENDEYCLDCAGNEKATQMWNENFEKLLCAHLAELIRSQLILTTDDRLDLIYYKNCRVQTDIEKPGTPKTWEYILVPSELKDQDNNLTEMVEMAVSPTNLPKILQTLMYAVVRNYTKTIWGFDRELKAEWVESLRKQLESTSKYTKTKSWERLMNKYSNQLNTN